MAYPGDTSWSGAPKASAPPASYPSGHPAPRHAYNDSGGPAGRDRVPTAPVIGQGGKDMLTLDHDDERGAEKPECKDMVWAVLLATVVGTECVLAVSMGLPAVTANRDVISSSGGQGLSFGSLAGIIGGAVAASALLSMAAIVCVTRNAHCLVQATVFASIALNVLLAIVSFFISSLLSILWVIFAVFGICFWCSVRNRVPFASAHLEIAGTAVRRMPMTICWAYVSIVLGAVYVMVWAVASLGIVASYGTARAASSAASETGAGDTSSPSVGESVVYVLQLLALYWGTNFVRFSLHTVVAGSVGTWWAVRDPKDPTTGSIRRAWTTSCGSISLAALLIAIIQTIRTLVRQAQRQAMERGGMAAACCLTMLSCLLTCIEQIARYISSYALVRVALFGEGFIDAGRATMAMFQQRGWDAVINDVIIERTLLLLSLLVGAASAAIAAAIGYLATPDLAPDARTTAVAVAALVGFLLGLACSTIVAVVMDSGVKTIFVAFAEQPDGLRAHHPELFRKLLEAWAQFYPEELQDAGYASRYGVRGHH